MNETSQLRDLKLLRLRLVVIGADDPRFLGYLLEFLQRQIGLKGLLHVDEAIIAFSELLSGDVLPDDPHIHNLSKQSFYKIQNTKLPLELFFDILLLDL